MNKIFITDQDRLRLCMISAVFLVFFWAYTAYSVEKYKTLKTRSLVTSNVVMKVIQHNVNSVCPRCGSLGIPLCPVCQVPMYWNGFIGSFVCPACGQGGFPRCPGCGEYMTWLEPR